MRFKRRVILKRLRGQAIAVLALLWLLDSPLVVAATGDSAFLTSEQKTWVDTHATELQIAPEANYPPFSYVEDGVWRGLSADVLKRVEEKLGTKFQILPAQNLNSVLEQAKRGDVGIVTSVGETSERSEYLAFTRPYVSIPTVIIVRAGAKAERWPQGFAGKQVAVGKGYGVQKFLEKSYPDAKVVPVADDQAGLRRLSNGEIDAVVMDLASASFFIEKEKITNLYVFSSFGYTYNLSFAVRKDLTVLREILNLALEELSARDQMTIADNWHLNLDSAKISAPRYGRFWPDAWAIFALMTLVGFMIWQTSQRRRLVASQSKALGELGQRLPAVLVVLGAFFLLTLLWQDLNARHERDLQDNLSFEAKRITTKISERMQTYGQFLRGAAGLFAASKSVERDEWRAFVEKLSLDHAYRGIQGVGFSLLIPKEHLKTHINSIRKQGFADYNLRPSGDRPVYTSIVYLEPFSERNMRAFGYDMFSEPVRNEAMSRARDRNDVVLSAKVKLVQETSTDIQAGLLAYCPVYKNGAIILTQQQRRAALIGWVYSPYRMNDLLEPILANELSVIRLEIFDEGALSQDSLLFDSQRDTLVKASSASSAAVSSTRRIEVGGRVWTLRYSASHGYAETFGITPLRNERMALIVVGFLISALAVSFLSTRRRAEIIADELTDSLRQSEERYRSFFDNSPDAYFVMEIEGGTISYCNKSGERMLHGTQGQIIGLKPGQVSPAFQEDGRPSSEGVSEIIETSMKNGVHRFDWIHQTLDGNDFWAEVTISVERVEDRKVLLVCWRDITERRQMQRELTTAKNSAETANRSKDLFLAMVSHELRTPLTAILSWAQLLERGILPPEKAKVGVRTIKESALAQNQLIEDLLDVSRIITGKLIIQAQRTNAWDILRSAVESLRPSAEAKSIIIEENCEAAELFISADPARLKQVFWNILSNSIKFTLAGGKIILTLSEVKDSGIRKAQISIQDTGKGINPEFVPHIFERFSQADSSSIRVHGGLGLGLSLVKSLVEMQGGVVTVSSPGEGKGTTVSIEFQSLEVNLNEDKTSASLSARSTQRAVQDAARMRILAGLRVLVVDDDSSTVVVLTEVLKSFGLRVTTATSAAEALRAFGQETPDILISDLSMPGEDGYSLMQKIRARSAEQGGEVPSLALSAHAAVEDVRRALAAGFGAHMAKPVDASELLNKIVELRMISHHEASSSAAKNSDLVVVETSSTESTVFDPAALLRRLRGDPKIAKTLCATFLDILPQRISEFKARLQAGDHEGAKISVHTIKGAAANVAGERLCSVAREIEKALGVGDLPTVKRKMDFLTVAFEELRTQLKEWMAHDRS